jgi:formylglycine-generating enzyme required for sulfatase activity
VGHVGSLADGGAATDGASGGGGWVSIPAGSFMMGSPPTEACRGGDEDRHQVTLTRGFRIMRLEASQARFGAEMGYQPSQHAGCDDCPVEQVSWHEAAAFCNALSTREGLAPCYECAGAGAAVSCKSSPDHEGGAIYDCPGYRLPTEAEWEYACRAGATSPLYTGAAVVSCSAADSEVDEIAWYDDNAAGTTHPGGQKRANPWGLSDMAGNVWEWVHDRYRAQLGAAPVTDPVETAGAQGLSRGGAINEAAGHARAAFRNPTELSFRDRTSGVRCVRRD